MEDLDDDRRLLDLACRRAGLPVTWGIAPDLQAARAMLDRVAAGDLAPPALAIVDLQLPDGSGSEVLGRLARELPAVPFVLFTTSTAPADHALVPAGSRGTYLVKPDSFAGYGEILAQIRAAFPAG